MTIQQQKSVASALSRAGISFEMYKLTDGTLAIMAKHDYFGMYPTDDARAAHTKVTQIASRRGLFSESRGYMTGTLIR